MNGAEEPVGFFEFLAATQATNTYTHAHTPTHKYTHSHTHTHQHTPTHKYTHSHTHAHTNPYMSNRFGDFLGFNHVLRHLDLSANAIPSKAASHLATGLNSPPVLGSLAPRHRFPRKTLMSP